jgi:hypothetical protein
VAESEKGPRVNLGPLHIEFYSNTPAVLVRCMQGIVLVVTGSILRTAGVPLWVSLPVFLAGLAVILSVWFMPNEKQTRTD